ncbi:Na+/H+ antiporter subunit A [Auritidibacter ignavus]|uniref:Na+/H+ antiporter subunit A n=1 Tax=Auritidibacter ignavus TaxID=678932 RepID=UPI000D735308|nr:Na+/H+ antiporter subunit A [Auritidibacter ignavus]PXA78567.1 Na+/H+ antiporter subunit A [Auritidibacter sp. NML120779]WGH81396.1 Na+/H+ antiporter subunit A [Auritidibacter ignavus]WGH90607.1 Na+/H+ antiporter subunit A [Auritidibacter ignavus]WHS35566.1 Na+/H+ antiporter subunit A [Auritidibacter ignavus]
MLIVLIALFAVALVAPWIFRVTDRAGFFVLAAVPAAGFIWVLTQMPHILHSEQLLASGAAADAANDPLVRTYPWLTEIGVELSFRMDTLAALMSLIVLGVGALVLVYCSRYFSAGDPRNGTFGAQLLAFAGAMFGLVTTDDLLVLYIFWEITSVLSFLLIGYAGQRIFARRSAITALIVTTFGGLAMLVGLMMLGESAGTYRISEVVNRSEELLTGPYSGAFMGWAIGLVLLGALTKSAQVPFHFWLPAAMAAPTPVSAYLHSAAMVKAGVYLVARLAPGYADMPVWQVMVLGVGMWTMLVGGWRALRQTDIKLVLAFGTVSQLGFLMIANGLGDRDAAMAGLAMLMAHTLFKAPLFMLVGLIDKMAGTRDVNRLSGLGRNHPWLFAFALLASLSMAGIPPFFGFVAKESVLESALHWGEVHSQVATDAYAAPSFWGIVWAWLPLAVAVLGSVFTVAYTARFLWGGFATKTTVDDQGVTKQMEDTPVEKSASILGTTPAAVLSVISLVAAFVPGLMGALPKAYGQTAEPLAGFENDPAYLALWHGFTPVLAISIAIILVGLVLYAFKDRVWHAQDAVPSWVDSAKVYRWTLQRLDAFAVWVTGRTQRGDLAFYLFIILTVATVGPLLAMLFPTNNDPTTVSLPNVAFFGDWRLEQSPGLVLASICMIIAVAGAVWARRRFMAVMLVSATGYVLAAIFALRGSPDLALTQLLVESIVLVAMVLGLRVLPPRVPTGLHGRNNRWARALLSIGFGLVMMWLAATVLASRVQDPISLKMPELAAEEGGGYNIVNVTLVDMRAWDTFGEITVLTAAATGVASLVFIATRERFRHHSLADVEPGSVGRYNHKAASLSTGEISVVRGFSTVSRDPWLIAGRTLAPERRSIIFEVVTRLIFHVIILISIYLLLAGHNVPGGGFAGGLLAGLALTIRYLAAGRYELAQTVRIPAGVVLGSGLALAAISGIIPLFFGGEVFQQVDFEFTLPVFGYVHAASALIFDIGVYLVVIGLVIDVLRSLGAEVDRRYEKELAVREEAEARRKQVSTQSTAQPRTGGGR